MIELLSLARIEALKSTFEDGSLDELKSLIEDFHTATRAEILQMETALAEGSLAEVKKKAHRIRGGSLNLGAVELAKIAQNLESAAANENRAEVESIMSIITDCAEKTAEAHSRLWQ